MTRTLLDLQELPNGDEFDPQDLICAIDCMNTIFDNIGIIGASRVFQHVLETRLHEIGVE